MKETTITNQKQRYLTLSDDPVEALKQIAECIETKMVLKGRRYPADADKREFKGYWQSIDFIYDLQAIAHQIGKYDVSST